MTKKIILLIITFLTGVGSILLVDLLPSNIFKDDSETILVSPVTPDGKKFQKQVVGFLPYWLLSFARESYDDTLTTLTYFGLGLNTDGTIQKKLNPREEEPGWTTLNKDILKERISGAKLHSLKTSLLVHNSNEEDINTILQQPEESAHNLIDDVTPIMREYKFDDLNIDIESFTVGSSSSAKFARFIETLKNGLEENSLGTLTVEITPSSLIRKRLIDPQAIGKIADYIIIMAYDYHYIYSFVSGPVAPLRGAGDMWDYDVTQTVSTAVRLIPKEKIILGIPLYGYEWEILDSSPRSAVIPYSGKTASNKRVETLLSDCKDCVRGVDDYGQVPYVIIPESNYFRVIFYEDKESLAKKLKLADDYGLGGVAFWALGYEDSTILDTVKNYR